MIQLHNLHMGPELKNQRGKQQSLQHFLLQALFIFGISKNLYHDSVAVPKTFTFSRNCLRCSARQ